MADRFSKQNELEKIRQLLAEESAKISLPDNLKGENLLHLLDGIEQEPLQGEKKQKAKIYFLSWQAFVTYAAMLAIVFASVRGIPRKNNQFVGSSSQTIEVKLLEDEEATYPEDWEEGTPVHQSPAGGGHDVNAENATGNEPPLGGPGDNTKSTPPAASQEMGDQTAAAVSIADAGDIIASAEPFGVGGGSRTTSLGEWNGLDITWRPNDPTDPDKGLFPVTIELVDLDNNEIHQQIDLEQMQRIDSFQSQDNALVFIGSTKQGDLAQVYSANTNQEIAFVTEINYPDGLYLHEIHGNTLYTVASSNGLADGWESTVLRDSTETGSAYLAATNLQTGNTQRLALQGVSGAVTLENYAFVVTYQDSEESKRIVTVQYSDNSLDLVDTNESFE